MRNQFKPVLEIISRTGILHFRRWTILKTPWFDVYLHGIYQADSDQHLHDHPWDYTSYILHGEFVEKSLEEGHIKYHKVRRGQLIKNRAERFHKINALMTKSVYTLFITGKPKRDWGYWVNGTWIQHDEYRKLKSAGTLNLV